MPVNIDGVFLEYQFETLIGVSYNVFIAFGIICFSSLLLFFFSVFFKRFKVFCVSFISFIVSFFACVCISFFCAVPVQKWQVRISPLTDIGKFNQYYEVIDVQMSWYSESYTIVLRGDKNEKK